MSQQQQVISIPPMMVIAGVWFTPHVLMAVDTRDYEAGKKDRVIEINVAGSEISFLDDDADAFKLWWDQVTGQSRIQPAPPGLKLT